MRKGSKLLRLAFTRPDISTIYKALRDYRNQLMADENAPAAVRAMEAADIDAIMERIVKGIHQLGGLDALSNIAATDKQLAREVVDNVAAKHSKRMRSRNGAK